MHSFFRGLLGIVQLYLMLLLLLLMLFFVLSNMEPLILNWMFMIVLTMGVFMDSSSNWKSKMMMMVVSAIQLFMYYYLELMPILMVKDFFWFSLVLNIAFMWHVLMLHWGFEMSLYYKWDYGCYMFSRMSVLTSLTGMYWLLNWMSFLVNWINDYFHCVLNLKKMSGNLNGIEGLISKFKDFTYPMNLMMAMFKAMVLYFMNMFKNYSLLLLGKTSNPFCKQPIGFYLSFFVLFIVSMYLMIPRIYMIWGMLLMLKSMDVLYKTMKAGISAKNWSLIVWFIKMESEMMGDYLTEPGFNENWDSLYNKEYYLDFKMFCDNLDWFFCDYVYESSPYNLYDMFEVFMYSKDSSVSMMVNYCSFTDVIDTCYMNLYNLDMMESQFSELMEQKRKLPYMKNPNSMLSRVTLWDYIRLEQGHYL